MANYPFSPIADRILSLSLHARVDGVEAKLVNRQGPFVDPLNPLIPLNPPLATDGDPKRVDHPFGFSFETGLGPSFALLSVEASAWSKVYRAPFLWVLGGDKAFPAELNEVFYNPTAGVASDLIDRGISFRFDPTKAYPELQWNDDLGGEGVMRLLPGQPEILLTLRVAGASTGKLSLFEGHPWGGISLHHEV